MKAMQRNNNYEKQSLSSVFDLNDDNDASSVNNSMHLNEEYHNS